MENDEKLRLQTEKELVESIEAGNFGEALTSLNLHKDKFSEIDCAIYETEISLGLGDKEAAMRILRRISSLGKACVENQKKSNLEVAEKHITALINNSEGKFYDSAYNYYLAKEAASKVGDEVLVDKFDQCARMNYSTYIEKFQSIAYNSRKIITVSKSNTFYKSDSVSLLNIDALLNINFPLSHPQLDATYVCHPYNTNNYLPIDSYESELLSDRINEFCYLLQSLGATSIKIKKVKGENSNEKILENQKRSGGLGGTVQGVNVKANVNINHEGHNDTEKEERLEFNREQYFNPTKKPHIPDNLVWFPHETSWQRLSTQRLDGAIVQHHETISSMQNEIVNVTELNNLNADLNILKSIFSANGEKTDLNTADLRKKTETEWEITVNFKPIEEFEDSQNEDPQISSLVADQIVGSTEEENFISEVKFFLEDDGMIDDTERRLLNRVREKLNISEERAIELENTVKNSNFSDLEKEYLAEYKSFTNNGNVLSDRERLMLNKVALLLEISDDRKLEIEKYCES